MGSGLETKPLAVAIGIDIGRRRDPTAVCVVERQSRPGATGPMVQFIVRLLDRLPLGTPYPKIAQCLQDLVGDVAERTGLTPVVYVDASGVGLPVVDLLRAAVPKAGVVAVFFNHGDRRHEEADEVRLGKAFLVSRLVALFQTDRILLKPTPEAEVLREELENFEIRVDQNANEKLGAFKVGTHDDLVTALGLAVQVDHPGGGAFAWRAAWPARRGRPAGSTRSDWLARLRG
jgi:hypothetical protein